MKQSEKIRALVAEHLLSTTPMAQALTEAADAVEALERGMAAVVERIEQLEHEVLPRKVDVT